jgi:hypothetical protein
MSVPVLHATLAGFAPGRRRKRKRSPPRRLGDLPRQREQLVLAALPAEWVWVREIEAAVAAHPAFGLDLRDPRQSNTLRRAVIIILERLAHERLAEHKIALVKSRALRLVRRR